MPSCATSSELRPRLRVACSTVLGVVLGIVMVARAQQPAVADSGLSAFMQMVPLGAESKGAVIPSFDEAGRRTSLITAKAVRRIDDSQLYAEKLVVQMFHAEPESDVRIDLQTAFYHMAGGGILRSTERSRVSRADFQIEGDSLIFDTAKNQGRMTGNIRMVIFGAGILNREGESPSAHLPTPTK